MRFSRFVRHGRSEDLQCLEDFQSKIRDGLKFSMSLHLEMRNLTPDEVLTRSWFGKVAFESSVVYLASFRIGTLASRPPGKGDCH